MEIATKLKGSGYKNYINLSEDFTFGSELTPFKKMYKRVGNKSC